MMLTLIKTERKALQQMRERLCFRERTKAQISAGAAYLHPNNELIFWTAFGALFSSSSLLSKSQRLKPLCAKD